MGLPMHNADRMPIGEQPVRERVGSHLRTAIDDLRRGIERVAFWADALDGLSQPVPGYADAALLSRYRLPKSGEPNSGEREHRHPAGASAARRDAAGSGHRPSRWDEAD